jgi:hypothetical protein
MVALDEQSLAGFYGPDARQLAECHREVLVELLSASAASDIQTTSTDTPSEVWVH